MEFFFKNSNNFIEKNEEYPFFKFCINKNFGLFLQKKKKTQLNFHLKNGIFSKFFQEIIFLFFFWNKIWKKKNSSYTCSKPSSEI